MKDNDQITIHFTGNEHICKGCRSDRTYPDITCEISQGVGYSYDVSLFADYLYKGTLPRIDEIMQSVNQSEITMKMIPRISSRHPLKWSGTCTKMENGDLKLTLTNGGHQLTSTKPMGEKEWTLRWRLYGSGSIYPSMTQGLCTFDSKPIDFVLESELTLKTLTTFVLSKANET